MKSFKPGQQPDPRLARLIVAGLMAVVLGLLAVLLLFLQGSAGHL